MQRPSFWAYMVEELRRKFKDRTPLGSPVEIKDWCYANESTRENVFGWLGIGSRSVEKNFIEWALSRNDTAPPNMGGAGDFEMLHSLVAEKKYSQCLESGVSKGWSTLGILAALDQLNNGRLISIDMPYPKLHLEDWVGCCVPAGLHKRWDLLRLPDRNGLKRALSNYCSVDLYHYDSDKTYWGRWYAFNLVFPKMHKNSVFVMDDISDNFAFRDIVNKHNLDFKVYQCGSCWVGVIKIVQGL